jgi:hypothetical protein
MTFLGAALSSLAEGGYQPRLTDFRGGQNAKPLYELSRRCNDLSRLTLVFETQQLSVFVSYDAKPLVFETPLSAYQTRQYGLVYKMSR